MSRQEGGCFVGRNRQSPAAGQVEAWAAAQLLYLRFKTGCESGGARGRRLIKASRRWTCSRILRISGGCSMQAMTRSLLQRQLPPQELNPCEGARDEQTTTNLSHNLAIGVGQFSVQIPGQDSVQINRCIADGSAALAVPRQ